MIEPGKYVAPLLLPLAVGAVKPGLWCDTCLLPSRYEGAVYALGADGPQQIGTFTSCDRCQK